MQHAVFYVIIRLAIYYYQIGYVVLLQVAACYCCPKWPRKDPIHELNVYFHV